MCGARHGCRPDSGGPGRVIASASPPTRQICPEESGPRISEQRWGPIAAHRAGGRGEAAAAAAAAAGVAHLLVKDGKPNSPSSPAFIPPNPARRPRAPPPRPFPSVSQNAQSAAGQAAKSGSRAGQRAAGIARGRAAAQRRDGDGTNSRAGARAAARTRMVGDLHGLAAVAARCCRELEHPEVRRA